MIAVMETPLKPKLNPYNSQGGVLCAKCQGKYTSHHSGVCQGCRALYCACGTKLRPGGSTTYHVYKHMCKACQRKSGKREED